MTPHPPFIWYNQLDELRHVWGICSRGRDFLHRMRIPARNAPDLLELPGTSVERDGVLQFVRDAGFETRGEKSLSTMRCACTKNREILSYMRYAVERPVPVEIEGEEMRAVRSYE